MSKRFKCYHPKSEGFFEIPGVRYKGKAGTYHLMEGLTPAMTQDKLAELYEKNKQAGLPRPTNSIETFAIFEAATKLEGKVNRDEFNQLMRFIQRGLNQFPNTLSRAVYNSLEKENDEMMHNYGTSDAYSLKGTLVGPGNWVETLANKDILKLGFGTTNTKRINKVSQLVNRTNARVWRVNPKPTQREERVVGFDAVSGRLGLGCGRYSLGEFPAFRVLQVE